MSVTLNLFTPLQLSENVKKMYFCNTSTSFLFDIIFCSSLYMPIFLLYYHHDGINLDVQISCS